MIVNNSYHTINLVYTTIGISLWQYANGTAAIGIQHLCGNTIYNEWACDLRGLGLHWPNRDQHSKAVADQWAALADLMQGLTTHSYEGFVDQLMDRLIVNPTFAVTDYHDDRYHACQCNACV